MNIKEPRTYLSTDGGKYRVIHNGMPLSKDGTKAEALAAAKLHLLLPDGSFMWDGDKGEFVERIEP